MRKIPLSVFRGRVHKARGLMGKSHRSCDSYVKCIRDDHLLSRFLVSVLRRPADNRCSQLIGCMSFGIGSLVSSSEVLYGWFYLLGEEYGPRKHLRVTSQRSRPMRSSEEGADLRMTPDSVPDPDLNTINTPGPRDPRNRSRSSSQTLGSSSTANQSWDGGAAQRLPVSVARGKDGFGFTICSDCPVRVQSVDLGGPAHQAGLRHGDSVLQLNGLPVETWKCADLAHAIRSCPSQIVVVVWRGLPEVRSGCEALLRPPTHTGTTARKFLSHPAHSKHGRRWGQRSGVRSSLGALGSLWRYRKEDREEEEEEVTEYTSHTATLKGTRVTSSNGDNYIILSPVNPGGQLLQPVFQDRTGTVGRLYRTHPSRAQNLLHDNPHRSGLSRQPSTSHTSTLPPSPSTTTSSSSSVPPSNYGNYQNCTIVQSHRPGYGTYVTPAPRTLIFPVFVQPIDLCSPDRTLLMSEEMVLHQADLLPTKVMVLIYSDLLLFTREDKAGRCNVLQSPVYLNALQLRDVPSQPLHIHFLQNSRTCCCCLFSLEAFNIEQKVQVSLCLHDNIQIQLVAMETGCSHQPSDLPPDFSLLSQGQSDLLYRPPSPYSHLCDPLRPYSPSLPPPFSTTWRSPVWKERGGAEEERQQGEGESASETSENVGGVGRRKPRPHYINMKEEEESDGDEEEGGGAGELTFRPGVLRRSLSEGSLLQEPRSPRFLSDSTIHRLTRPATFDLNPSSGPAPRPPSPRTLRKQLSRESGSLHHMLLLLNGTKAEKGGESTHCQLGKKTKSLAADVRSRLTFLRRRTDSTGIHGNSLEKVLRNNRPSVGEVLRWADSLEALLTNQYGLAVFRHFLKSEFSEENLDFWLAVERFKRTRPFSKMVARSAKVYDEFISTNAVRQVNVDSTVRELTNQSLHLGISTASFQLAQDQIFGLMETDSYPRFLKSHLYAQLANHNTQTGTEPTNQSGAGGAW